ncbi:hypothetical protein ABTN13_20765, partial [Acinetobacter baumannii]
VDPVTVEFWHGAFPLIFFRIILARRYPSAIPLPLGNAETEDGACIGEFFLTKRVTKPCRSAQPKI